MVNQYLILEEINSVEIQSNYQAIKIHFLRTKLNKMMILRGH
jgi:hypothetical protein